MGSVTPGGIWSSITRTNWFSKISFCVAAQTLRESRGSSASCGRATKTAAPKQTATPTAILKALAIASNLPAFVVDSDFKGAQELLVLGGELDLSHAAAACLRLRFQLDRVSAFLV